MSKKSYIGINNTAHEVKKTYIGINGVARAVKKVYIGVNGVAREAWSEGHNVVIASGQSLAAMPGTNVIIDDVEYTFASPFNVVSSSTGKLVVNAGGTITLDGVTVVTGGGSYTVDLSSVTHVLISGLMNTISITTYNITESKDVTVTVNGTGAAAANITYNGVTYSSASTFAAKTGDLIYVSIINTTQYKYYYVVTSDVIVQLSASSNTTGGNVTFTEQ